MKVYGKENSRKNSLPTLIPVRERAGGSRKAWDRLRKRGETNGSSFGIGEIGVRMVRESFLKTEGKIRKTEARDLTESWNARVALRLTNPRRGTSIFHGPGSLRE